MITIFNRRELITITSTAKLYRVREALSAAGIASALKTEGAARGMGRARTGSLGLRQDAMYTYTLYVHRDDYEEAWHAIQPALLGREPVSDSQN